MINFLLTKFEADPNKGTRPAGKTPAHVCVEKGALNSLRLLLQSGASKDVEDGERKSLLLTAIEYQQLEIAAFLLDQMQLPVVLYFSSDCC